MIIPFITVVANLPGMKVRFLLVSPPMAHSWFKLMSCLALHVTLALRLIWAIPLYLSFKPLEQILHSCLIDFSAYSNPTLTVFQFVTVPLLSGKQKCWSLLEVFLTDHHPKSTFLLSSVIFYSLISRSTFLCVCLFFWGKKKKYVIVLFPIISSLGTQLEIGKQCNLWRCDTSYQCSVIFVLSS